MSILKTKNYIFSALFLICLNLILFSAPQQENTTSYFTPEDSLKSLRYLSSQISKVLTSANLNDTKYEIAIYSIDNNKYYFKKNIDEPLTPASLTKVFTCYSSLFLIDKNYQYDTKVFYSGKIENGILNGDIYLVGDGDPLFSSKDIIEFAKQIKDKGILQITGNIIADGSCFDNITNRVAYSGDKEIVQALQPISGLAIDQNLVTVIVDGINQRNSRLATVKSLPASYAFQINNTARVVGQSHGNPSKRTGSIQSDINENFGGPITITETMAKNIYISQQKSKGNMQVFNVAGNIDAGDSYSYTFYIDNPEYVAAGSLLYHLKAAGIMVNGSYLEGAIPPPDKLIQICSKKRPLLDIISPTLKLSDNYLAEAIYKKIGSYSGKMIDNAKEAKGLIGRFLEKYSLNPEEHFLFDGSGLSRRNKITGKTVISLLSDLYKSDLKVILDTTLAIAGVDGTVKNRMIGTLAEDNLRAKTCTHKNVSGLCGIVHTLDGEAIAYSFIFNGDYVGDYKKIENQLGILISEFFYFNKEQ
jgi:D-alanyl-D-alanine carboxypeptidase